MRIHIIVGGRFHAHRMAEGFIKCGHEVTIFTTLPASRFSNLKKARIVSMPWFEIASRVGKKLGFENQADLFKISRFGQAVANYIRKKNLSADVVIGWSSFALETLQLKHATHRLVIRDSTHIEHQIKLLKAEYGSLGIPFPDRSEVQRREMLEYRFAEEIIVLSEFAKKTFLDRGFSNEQLRILPLGVDIETFKTTSRLPPRLPLHVCYFGSIGVRKGVHYLLEAFRDIAPEQAVLTLVGPVERGFERFVVPGPQIRFLGSKNHADLARFLETQDLFVMPTLEDGFGQTLLQAMSSGLAVITTESCGAGERITNGKNGIIIPARSSEEIYTAVMSMIRRPEIIRDLGQSGAKVTQMSGWADYFKTISAWSREWMNEPAHEPTSSESASYRNRTSRHTCDSYR